MIVTVDTSQQSLPASGEVTRSRWYALRILRAANGAVIAWNSSKDTRGAYAGAVYQDRHGINGVWITSGAVVLEYTDDPDDILPPASVTGSQVDVLGNLTVVGPGAVGAAPVGNPLYIAGTDVAGNLQAISAELGKDRSTAATLLNGAGSTLTLALAGKRGALLAITGGGALGANFDARYSMDGGTTFQSAYLCDLTPSLSGGAQSGVMYRPANQGATSFWSFVIPNGATHVRIGFANYVAGSCTAQIFATDSETVAHTLRAGGQLLLKIGATSAFFPTAPIKVAGFDEITVLANVTTLSAANNVVVNALDPSGNLFPLGNISVAAVAKVIATFGKGSANNNGFADQIELTLSGGTPILDLYVYGK